MSTKIEIKGDIRYALLLGTALTFGGIALVIDQEYLVGITLFVLSLPIVFCIIHPAFKFVTKGTKERWSYAMSNLGIQNIYNSKLHFNWQEIESVVGHHYQDFEDEQRTELKIILKNHQISVDDQWTHDFITELEKYTNPDNFNSNWKEQMNKQFQVDSAKNRFPRVLNPKFGYSKIELYKKNANNR